MQTTLPLLADQWWIFIACLRLSRSMLYFGITISTLPSLLYWFLVNPQCRGRGAAFSGNGLWVALPSLSVILSIIWGFSALYHHQLCCIPLSAVHLLEVLFFCIKCCWLKVWLFTSFYIIQTVLLILLFHGCELWSPTSSEIIILERLHWKILRTIQGLPLCCHSRALKFLMGVPSIVLHSPKTACLHPFLLSTTL